MTQIETADFDVTLIRAGIAANVRAWRARADLTSAVVAERMRELGFGTWLSQTVSVAEHGKRRITAEEIYGLAIALNTTTAALMDQHVAVRSPGG